MKKSPGLMKGHDTSHMGIDETRLGDWITKQGKGEEKGHLESGDTSMKQTENTTRREQSGK